MPLSWRVDECAAYFDRLHLRGWCFQATPRVVRVEAVFAQPATVVPVSSFGLPSPDVAAAIESAAGSCRFDEWLAVPPDALGHDFTLRFTLADGSTCTSDSVVANAVHSDRYFACWGHFLGLLDAFNTGTVLELGSRLLSAASRRDLLPPRLGYVGLDILPGPGVDVVGDAHELEKLFGRARFVAVFSLSVFEHLAMPWKVALELNRVLVPGGLVFVSTHQTWPLHEEPWDFWRFSPHTWRTIFNAASGFEVVEAACGEPAHVHAWHTHPATRGLPDCPAYLGSAAIVRKVAETSLTWPVSLSTAATGMYPAGELTKRPQ